MISEVGVGGGGFDLILRGSDFTVLTLCIRTDRPEKKQCRRRSDAAERGV